MNIDSKVWLKRAKEVSIEEIPNFINELINSVDWEINDDGYANIIKVMYISMMATFYGVNNSENGNITGSQVQTLAWKLFMKLMGIEEGTPLKMINYEGMLNPYNGSYFDKIIDKEFFEWLQNKARELLKDNNCSPTDSDIIVHLLKIVDGEVPFGYTLKEEYDKAIEDEREQEDKEKEMEWREGAEQEND